MNVVNYRNDVIVVNLSNVNDKNDVMMNDENYYVNVVNCVNDVIDVMMPHYDVCYLHVKILVYSVHLNSLYYFHLPLNRIH